MGMHQNAMKSLSKYDEFVIKDSMKLSKQSNLFGVPNPMQTRVKKWAFAHQSMAEIENDYNNDPLMTDDIECEQFDIEYRQQMIYLAQKQELEAKTLRNLAMNQKVEQQKKKIAALIHQIAYNQALQEQAKCIALRRKNKINQALFDLYIGSDPLYSLKVRELRLARGMFTEWNIEHIDGQKYKGQKYKNALMAYLALNQNELNNEEYITFPNSLQYKQSDLLQIYQVTEQHEYIQKLQGQYGVLAKKMIPCNTIFMKQEFESLFVEECVDYNLMLYALDDKNKHNALHHLVLNTNYLYFDQFQFCQFMNDPRVRFCGNQQFEAIDYDHWNVDIIKGEELMVCYDFWRGTGLDEVEHCRYKLRKICDENVPIPEFIRNDMQKQEIVIKEQNICNGLASNDANRKVLG